MSECEYFDECANTADFKKQAELCYTCGRLAAGSKIKRPNRPTMNGKYVEWDNHIRGLKKDIRMGCCEATVGIQQMELGGKRVELQLHITDDDSDFCLDT